MSEDTPQSDSTPEPIQVPQAPRLNLPEGDIVAGKAEKTKRASAVVGMVDRPTTEAPRGGGGGRRGGDRRGGPGGDRRGGRRGDRGKPQAPEVEAMAFEKVVHINRCAKVVSGGRRFSFAALVVVGDTEGNIGVGYGKAKEVPECIRKGTERAKRNMKPVERRNNTIPHEALGVHDGGRVLLRPAVPGTGVIAGGGVRAVLEAAGVKDVLTKSLGSNNPGAVVFATLDALSQMRSSQTINTLRRSSGEVEGV